MARDRHGRRGGCPLGPLPARRPSHERAPGGLRRRPRPLHLSAAGRGARVRAHRRQRMPCSTGDLLQRWAPACASPSGPRRAGLWAYQHPHAEARAVGRAGLGQPRWRRQRVWPGRRWAPRLARHRKRALGQLLGCTGSCRAGGGASSVSWGACKHAGDTQGEACPGGRVAGVGLVRCPRGLGRPGERSARRERGRRRGMRGGPGPVTGTIAGEVTRPTLHSARWSQPCQAASPCAVCPTRRWSFTWARRGGRGVAARPGEPHANALTSTLMR